MQRGARRSNSRSSTGRGRASAVVSTSSYENRALTRTRGLQSIGQYDENDDIEIIDDNDEVKTVNKRKKHNSGKGFKRIGVVFSADSDNDE